MASVQKQEDNDEIKLFQGKKGKLRKKGVIDPIQSSMEHKEFQNNTKIKRRGRNADDLIIDEQYDGEDQTTNKPDANQDQDKRIEFYNHSPENNHLDYIEDDNQNSL